jgi:hypothetical protein
VFLRLPKCKKVYIIFRGCDVKLFLLTPPLPGISLEEEAGFFHVHNSKTWRCRAPSVKLYLIVTLVKLPFFSAGKLI